MNRRLPQLMRLQPQIAPVDDELAVSPKEESFIPGRYIVMFKPALFDESGETTDGKTVVTLAEELVGQTEGRLATVLEIVNGFVVEGLTKQDLAMLSKNPMVMAIEQDRLVSVDPVERTSVISQKVIFVGAEQVDCEGVGPQKCLWVKEDIDGEWELFYDTIVGFSWESGFIYELRVRVDQVQNPPADGSSMLWTLMEVVEKTAVTE